MAQEPQVIMLNGGRDVSVGLVSGADAVLMQLLGGAPSKTGWATLKVVKNAADVPFVAIFITNKHVGFLSHADADGLLSALAHCEQKGAVATAKAVLAVPTDGTATPALQLDLASPDRLLTAPTQVATSPIVALPQNEPLPAHHCQSCGKPLPADARFCLACGTPVAQTPAPGQSGVAPASSVRSAQPVAAPASVLTAPTAAPPSQAPWQPQFAKAPVKSRGWWRRQSSMKKALLISGAVVVLLVVSAIASAVSGGSGNGAKDVAGVTTSSVATTPQASATSETVTTTAETPTAATDSAFYTKYTGTGSKIVDLGSAPDDHFILSLTTSAQAEVEKFGSDGEGADFLLGGFSCEDGKYKGRILGNDVAKLQINTKGSWTLELQPITDASRLACGETYTGTSDDVIALVGNPSSLVISGNSTNKFENFIVDHYETGSSWPDVLVNELGEYSGVSVVSGDGLLPVRAQFAYTIKSVQ